MSIKIQYKEITMFDVQIEFEILHDRLQDLLALDCLEGDVLADALTTLGYIRCVLDYKGHAEAFKTVEAHIEDYEKVSALC